MKAGYYAALTAAALTMLAIGVPAQATDKDDRIVAAAKKTYVFKTYLRDDDIKIESRDGVVALTGIVADGYRKTLAQETMAGLPWVVGVDNRLEVRGALPTANSDAWLREKVRVTLLFHRSVDAGATEVSVTDGVVTLRGTAANPAQRELTTEYAGDVEGVKDVKNEMTVTSKRSMRTASEGIDDASITAQVKLALLLHRSTSASSATVATTRGIVTVGGTAGSAAEMELVLRIVNDVNGVKGVTNRMAVR